MSYCSFIETMKPIERMVLHKNYHDNHYGFPIHDDNELFGRLIMEINQAGLSWETILKKENTFRKAYDNFNIQTVANYTVADRERLMNDAGIIRNKLKINAAIENAKKILLLQKEFEQRNTPVQQVLQYQNVDPRLVVAVDQIPAARMQFVNPMNIPGGALCQVHPSLVA